MKNYKFSTKFCFSLSFFREILLFNLKFFREILLFNLKPMREISLVYIL